MQKFKNVFMLILLMYVCPYNAENSRKDAFINYEEKVANCHDQLPDCRTKAVHNLCISDPYLMRRYCPQSCVVNYCVNSGTLKFAHKGYATMNGTNSYVEELTKTVHVVPTNYRLFRALSSSESLKLSSLGVGTYLGALDAKTDEAVTAAVIYSVSHGWNVIDTASNYRYGQAEISVGQALDSLLSGNLASTFPAKELALGYITRDMLFISSKVGFTSEPLLKKLLDNELIMRSDVVQNAHCMHPEYINASLHESLERMHLKTLDLLYLHNPAEMQLPAVGRQEFMKRLEVAFATMEAARTEGLIRYYGIASWDCFRRPPGDKVYLSLEEVVEVAEAVGGEQHGFKFIQLPINAVMMEALDEFWQPFGAHNKTLLQAAFDLGVSIFTSGPLLQAQLVQRYTSELDGIKELLPQHSTPGKLLQMVRSTPSVLSTLVGHKTREWVESNLQISLSDPLNVTDFLSAQSQMERLVIDRSI